MNIACCKAYGALGIPEYRDRAIANMRFLRQHLKGENLYLFYHAYKDGQAKFPAFLDDYAYLIAAGIQLQEITGDGSYLIEAKQLMEFVQENFREEETGMFFFTHRQQQDLILRKKEIYDGAIPSGNAYMAFNLAYMGVIFNIPEWKEQAVRMAGALGRPVTPLSRLFWGVGNPVSGVYVYYSGDRYHRQAAGKRPEGAFGAFDPIPGLSVGKGGEYPVSFIARQACRGNSVNFPM